MTSLKPRSNKYDTYQYADRDYEISTAFGEGMDGVRAVYRFDLASVQSKAVVREFILDKLAFHYPFETNVAFKGSYRDSVSLPVA